MFSLSGCFGVFVVHGSSFSTFASFETLCDDVEDDNGGGGVLAMLLI